MPLMLKFDVQNKASSEVNKLQKDLDKLKVSTKGAETSFGGLNSSLVKVAGGFYALSKSADLAKSFIRQADEVTLLNSQLKLVTNSTQELIKVEKELFSLSQESRQSISATTNLYARLARASQDLGVSKKDLLTVTETVNKALIVSGASASEASSAITQLSQGLASGVLRGEEFNSITENGTRIAQALSDSLGVTTGQLRAMAMEGKLTSEVVIKALTGESDKIGKEFKKMGITVGQSMQVVENSTMKAIGTINRDFNITTSIAKEMDAFARLLDKNIGDIVNYLQVVKATASIVSNGYESIMATSAIGYLSIAYEFETELESIGNTMIEVTNTTIKELAKTFNEVNEYWGLGLDKVSFTDFKPIDINGDEIKNDIDTLKLKIVELGIKTDESFKIIANGGADASIAIGKIAESGESTKKVLKEITNIKFGDFLNKSYLSMLDSQIELAESTNEWNDNLEGVAGTIQGLGKVFAKFNVDNLKATKAQFQLDSKYQKFTEDNKLNEVELTQLNTQYLKEKSSIDEQNTRNQLDGYGQLSGAMSNMFEEGSREAKALIGIQQALSIVTGITAIANAMASGDGYTAVARGLAVAGTLASFGWAGGGGGSSSSVSAESKRQDNIASNIKGIEAQSSPILERLDSQIKLLESIDNSTGSATYKSLTQARAEYDKDIKIFAQESSAKATTSWKSFIPVGSEQELFNLRERVASDGKILSELIGGYSGLYFDYENKYSSGKRTGYEATYTSANILENPDYMIKYLSNISEFEGSLLDINNVFTSLELEEVVVNAQSVFSKFAVSIRDTVAELSDMSDTFKDLYDSITGTTSYSDEKLRLAREAVLGKNGIVGSSSITDYLSEQIKAITLIENSFDESVRKLLLSTDSKDIEAQSELLIKLQESTSSTFIDGAETALNYLDSIKLVGEAMATSTDNIKSWSDQFKSKEELASDLSEGLTYITQEAITKTVFAGMEAIRVGSRPFGGGIYQYVPIFKEIETLVDMINDVSLVGSMEELSSLFTTLSTDVDGLTNAELDFLNANKALIEARANERDSLQETYDLLTGATTQRELQLASLDDSNKALQEAIWAEEDRQKAISESQTLIDRAVADFTSNMESMAGSIDSTINTIKGNMLDDSLTTDQIRRLNLTQRAFETSIGAGDSDKAKELLSEITTLATGISSGTFGDTSKINQNLISSLEANKAMIDFKDEVLMVRIVASDLDYTQATQAVTPSVYVTNSTNNDDRLATLEAIMTEVLKTNINVYDLLLRIQNNGLKTI